MKSTASPAGLAATAELHLAAEGGTGYMRLTSRRIGMLCLALAASCASAADKPPLTGPSGSDASVAPPMVAIAHAFTMPEAPLDLAALKLRLRETSAIGVFAKLALRNQLDELLQQLRSHHLGTQTSSVAGLRLAYESLVINVLAKVRDGDPALARTISASREAIWIILADPEQFDAAS